MSHPRPVRAARGSGRPNLAGTTERGLMHTEQTTDRTFRVTVAPDGQVGVTVFVDERATLVLWLGSDNHAAAQRLALHLETQVDALSGLQERVPPLRTPRGVETFVPKR